MDEMDSHFGRLSTKASEWKPSSAHARDDQSFDITLKPVGVQEFVPGQGWQARAQDEEASNYTQQPPLPHGDNLQNDYAEATLASGPTPPSEQQPAFQGLHSLGVSDDLWRYYRQQSLESIRQMDPADPLHRAIPLPFCNAFLLDSNQKTGRSSFGYPCSTFMVTNRDDGHLYCLRRFDSVRSVSPKIAATICDRWTRVQPHPSIVTFYQCFVATRAVFFVHQYIPTARSLQQLLLNRPPLSEAVVWSVLAQLVSAIRAIHGNNLAVQTLDSNHVLATVDSTNSRLRVRIKSCGIVDALEFEARKQVLDLQQQDMRKLGRLLLSLTSGTHVTPATDNETLRRCASRLNQKFSPELHNLIMTLIRSMPQPPTIIDVSRAIAQRLFEEQDAVYRSLDRTEQAIAAEYESGRALRLLLKLGFINERPEFGPNQRWSQSGDCYVLSLFRDYGTFEVGLQLVFVSARGLMKVIVCV
jgi:PAB-dependent poly(A)-specific ribonuclease subunit 3